MLATPDQQISLTDPDSRSMATSGRGSGIVGYNVQVAVDTEHHLIITHEVTNVGNGPLTAFARGQAGEGDAGTGEPRCRRRSRLLRQRGDSGVRGSGHHGHAAQADDLGHQVRGRFGKQDFRYLAEQDVYICPAGERLAYHYTNEEQGLVLRRYWTNACQSCAIKHSCTTGKERRITRWEHEHVLEAVQRRLDEHPEKMRQRRETVEHPFGTIKARMGATHFLMKTLPKVATEMALHVLAYNLTRVMNIMGIQPLVAVIRA